MTGRGPAASRGVVLRDFVIFAIKLAIDGLKDVVLLPLAGVAVFIDMIRGGGRKSRLFYRVVRRAERFDRWLNLTGALDELERGETDDGLFGASKAGSDSLLGKLEGWVRGDDYDDPGKKDEREGQR